jgi:hypothetical protein
MIRKSGNHFGGKIMLKQLIWSEFISTCGRTRLMRG